MSRSFHATALAAARILLRAGEREGVLEMTEAILRRFASAPFPLPVAGGLPEVDLLLDALGCQVAAEVADSPPERPGGGDWILATSLSETGGHTPLIHDLAAALPSPPEGLVLTQTGRGPAAPTPGALARIGFDAGTVHCADGSTRVETCRAVIRLLRPRAPRRLFLVQHPDDTCAVAAAGALAAAGTELWFVHHADCHPTAGLFLPGARVLDLTPRACAFTRHVLGLSAVWLPLTCPDPGPAPAAFLRRGRLTTALSGGLFKSAQAELPPYAEVVATILRATGGIHVHVGPLYPHLVESIGRSLAEAGLDAARFVHVPSVPNLVEALRAEGVDLLVNTWPLGGARTSVEAMAAGIPVVWHSPHPAFDRIRCQMAWPGAPVWRRPRDLAVLLSAVDAPWLRERSQAARRWYEERHHPARWRAFFASPDSAAGEPLPAGFDATLFLPALWGDLVDRAAGAPDSLVDVLRPFLLGERIRSRLRRHLPRWFARRQG